MATTRKVLYVARFYFPGDFNRYFLSNKWAMFLKILYQVNLERHGGDSE